MKELRIILLCSLFFINFLIRDVSGKIYELSEEHVCKTKTSCSSCLRLSQCSWCTERNTCFSIVLQGESYCQKNETTMFKDFGLSIAVNAECACSGDMERQCRPPGSPDSVLECSGRGQCLCGRCFCDPQPDPENPTKAIVGEFCELDNFSCSGDNCGEGPYSLHPADDDEATAADNDNN